MTSQLGSIRSKMDGKTSEELLRIYKERNENEWTPEALEVVRTLLLERGETAASLEELLKAALQPSEHRFESWKCQRCGDSILGVTVSSAVLALHVRLRDIWRAIGKSAKEMGVLPGGIRMRKCASCGAVFCFPCIRSAMTEERQGGYNNAICSSCRGRFGSAEVLLYFGMLDENRQGLTCPICAQRVQPYQNFVRFLAFLGGGLDLIFPSYWCDSCKRQIPLSHMPPDVKKAAWKMRILGVAIVCACIAIVILISRC
jgi:hypothetical protein